MMKSIKGCNKLNTLNEVWLELDGDMKVEINRIIDSNGEGSSLLRLFKIYELPNQLGFPTSLFKRLMGYYEVVNDQISYFIVGDGQHLNITLEDVLYLTGFPIRGKPVFPEPQMYKDFEAFPRVFGGPRSKEITFSALKEICIDKNNTREPEKKMKAILFYIVNCVIIPNSTGKITTSYVHFVEKLDEVDSYAWGAAALAYLYEGLRRCKNEETGVGFMWLVLGFFFCRFNISDIFGVEFNRQMVPYTLSSLVKELAKKIGGNHYSKLHHDLGNKLMQLDTRLQSTDVDITWHPYTREMLPEHLHDQIRLCTFVRPLFCYEYMYYHRPDLVAPQFEDFGTIIDTERVESDLPSIKIKRVTGPNRVDLNKHYQKQLQMWGEMDRRLLQSFRVPNDDHASTSHTPLRDSTTPPPNYTHTPLRDFTPLNPSPPRTQPDSHQLDSSETDSPQLNTHTPLRDFTPLNPSPPRTSPRQDSGPQPDSHPQLNSPQGSPQPQVRQIRRRGMPDPVAIQPEGEKRLKKGKKVFIFSTAHLEKGRGIFIE